ncbi:SDR family oxidoreductase [Undibacterium jejuense]|uniref:SDR family oxidoreductase n=1 Tax=Undibacterium jejuense TaxID=1344949 RepID=A0A923HT81_9BURK|nr:SDR family oxidoreductase [Undibacterium jejuense]MBC3864293.1 SDR family oxidoreductase [Undibacterium jejuense]
MQRVLIVGATSAIAEAFAKQYAQQHASFFLLAKSLERLHLLAGDLLLRGATAVTYQHFDALEISSHIAAVDSAIYALGGIDIVLIAYGTLGKQTACEQDPLKSIRELNVNFVSVVALLTILAPRFVTQSYGTIAVISSVAGERGRQSNYVYGSAKAGLSAFLQGLRNRLHPSGVHVLTVKPGLVDTPMTSEFRKGMMWATPDAIASGIVNAIAQRDSVVYLPGFWRYIMLLIKLIPEAIFRRLSL